MFDKEIVTQCNSQPKNKKKQMLMEFYCLYKSIKLYNMNGGFFNIL